MNQHGVNLDNRDALDGTPHNVALALGGRENIFSVLSAPRETSPRRPLRRRGEHPAPYTPHLTPYTIHPKLHPLRPTPHTLHPTPYTLNPAPSILNRARGRAGALPLAGRPHFPPRPQVLDPEPSTLNPQPSTLNPQPSTLNPQP